MNAEQPLADDFLPTASLNVLKQRAAFLATLRSFFVARGFWEVETPLLSRDTVIDAYLEPIGTELPWRGAEPTGDDCPSTSEPTTFWLQTSPEFAMKRLLAAGADAIFQLAKAFRRDELGPRHNPEFTMLEWYRVGDSLPAGIELLANLCETLLPRGRPELVTYRQAFERTLAINPHRATPETLRAIAMHQGLEIPESLARATAQTSDESLHLRDEWLNLLLAECIEPKLGRARPCILSEYPASQAALAQIALCDGDEIAERFELYVDGIELANGYHELLDPRVLADRQRQTNHARAASGQRTFREDHRLLAAMQHGLPPCVGVAAGVDRWIMVALGCTRIDEVLAFPIDRA